MLYLLVVVLVLFLATDMLLSRNDWFHPSVVYTAVFLMYAVFCVLARKKYEITIEPMTVFVISMAMLLFCLLEWVKKTRRNPLRSKAEIGDISVRCNISKFYVVILIAMQVVSVVAFVHYLDELAAAYTAMSGQVYQGINQEIQLFDTMTKFWPDTYAKINLKMPMAYRITNPLCGAAEYIVLYAATKKFYCFKKIEILDVIVFLFMSVRILMNGSRSPLLRAITFVVCVYLLLQTQDGRKRKFSLRLILQFSIALGLLGIFMVALLHLMGRENNIALFEYLFIYAGAPIVNLDTFIKKNSIPLFHGVAKQQCFGAHTFSGLYSYISKWTPLEISVSDISPFTYSNNGVEIGNVYTMFQKLLYDFGVIGCFAATTAMAAYYVMVYKKISEEKRNDRVIDIRILIYAYLFNDLVMSAFSARFFETLFSSALIRFFPIVILLDYFCVEHDPIKNLVNHSRGKAQRNFLKQ